MEQENVTFPPWANTPGFIHEAERAREVEEERLATEKDYRETPQLVPTTLHLVKNEGQAKLEEAEEEETVLLHLSHRPKVRRYQASAPDDLDWLTRRNRRAMRRKDADTSGAAIISLIGLAYIFFCGVMIYYGPVWTEWVFNAWRLIGG